LSTAIAGSKPTGVLVLVVPGDRLSVCGRVLNFHFKDKRAYRLGTPEGVKYKQVVLFGVRRTRPECNHLSDADLTKAQNLIAEMRRKWEQLSVLPDSADAVYPVPESAPVELTHRGLPLDEIEDLLLKSAAYRQAARILTVCRAEIKGRPVTPLHGGHVALCAVAGLLDGASLVPVRIGISPFGDPSRSQTVLKKLKKTAPSFDASARGLPTSSLCYTLQGKPPSCVEPLLIDPTRWGILSIPISIRWNYTSVLNIIFIVLAVVLLIRFFRTGGLKMLKMMDDPPAEHRMHHG
jgi:hypothetical protein